MRSVQLLEIAMGGMAVVFLALYWARGRRIERVETRVDQLEQGDGTPGNERIDRLERMAEEVDEALNEMRPQRKSRRRRWRVIEGGAVAVPIALVLAGSVTAAVAVLDRDVQGQRITPASLPKQRALPAEGDQPVTPGEAVSAMSAMEPPEAPTMERSTEAEIVSAPPPGGDPGEQGHGGGGLSVVPPDASPPSSPGDVEPPVAVESPEPTPPSGTPRVAGETGPAPLVDLDVGVVSVTVEREDA